MKVKSSNVVLFIGYLFLYLPLLCVAIFSFNGSRYIYAWGGFSLKWYKALLSDSIVLSATWTSIKIACIAATFSVILGTIAAIVISRFPRFRGKTFFVGAVTTPLVMPDIVMGLSSLMLFIGMEKFFGWPSGRGITTVIITHITFTISYIVMIVQARLSDLDRSIEEAALDLGASPLKVFFVITLPMILPAIIAGWLLAFALSVDDVVISSFVAGPGSTTLPMVIFSSLRFGISPQMNALATILITLLSIGVIIAAISMYQRKNLKGN